jgi:type IV pilus assembly protein PilA
MESTMQIARTRKGFTVLELMLVVGIIGVIAMIAIPNFISYQARSRRSEAFTNLSALARSQIAFQAEKNAFHDTAFPYPDPALYNSGVLSPAKMPWDGDSQTAFGALGWAPEGKVAFSYGAHTSASGGGCGSCPLCFTAVAYGDVDGNGSIQALLYVHPEDGAYCTEPVFGYGPPIDPDSGAQIFDAVAARSNNDF